MTSTVAPAGEGGPDEIIPCANGSVRQERP